MACRKLVADDLHYTAAMRVCFSDTLTTSVWCLEALSVATRMLRCGFLEAWSDLDVRVLQPSWPVAGLRSSGSALGDTFRATLLVWLLFRGRKMEMSHDF